MGDGSSLADRADFPEPPGLRRLRRLVTALTVTLIAGVVIIVALLVIRFGTAPSLPRLPSEMRLPAGESATAVTFGAEWVAVVTVDREGRERIRVFDARTGDERGVAAILPPAAP